jgi:hypothetical protein
MTLQKVGCTAIFAAVLAAASAGAAPIAPPAGISDGRATMTTPARLGDHPLMYDGNWRVHQRQWDAFEGRNARSSCARLRGYNRATHSYVNRSGRRVVCR